MPDSPFLSIVIPSYNEINNISRGALEEVHNTASKLPFSWEIVLSDDGSKDGTVEALKSFAENDSNIHVLANDHAGKGPTVTKGMLAANGQWRLFTDFDQSTPLTEVLSLLKHTDSADIVLGSREIQGAKRDKEPFHRHLMGRGFNLLVQILAVPGIQDTQCGFKLFSKQATEALFSHLIIYNPDKKTKGAFTGAFDVELLFIARKMGFKYVEVPINWKHYETDRVSPIKDSIRMLRDIVKIRLSSISGKYDFNS